MFGTRIINWANHIRWKRNEFNENGLQEYRNALSLTSSENSRLEHKNKAINLLKEEIASLERTLQSREYLDAQLNLKYTELEKLRNEKETEVGVTFDYSASDFNLNNKSDVLASSFLKNNWLSVGRFSFLYISFGSTLKARFKFLWVKFDSVDSLTVNSRKLTIVVESADCQVQFLRISGQVYELILLNLKEKL